MPIKIFISHSSRDEQIVQMLLRTLQESAEIPSEDIRCTSIDGYRLRPGVLTVEALAQDLTSATVVLGVLTPNSITSAWPLSELGAAWVLSKEPIALVSGHLTFSDMKGPLSATHALRLDSERDVNELIDTIIQRLTLKARPTAQRMRAINELTSLSTRSTAGPRECQTLMTRKDLQTPENKLRWTDIEVEVADEMFVWGWSCGNVLSPRTRNIFQRIVSKKVHLNFLVLDPEAVTQAKALRFGPVCNIEDKEIAPDIERGINSVRDLVRTLNRTDEHLVSLRKTNWVMSWSGVAIDPEKSTGLLQLEFFYYNNPLGVGDHLDTRPEFILTPESPFYRGFWGSVHQMWKSAQSVTL